MYTVQFFSYCGMALVPVHCEDRSEARAECAERLRRARSEGYKLATLSPGKRWEVLEPDDCMLVPDACGTLELKHVTFECGECGSACETREFAAECCTKCPHGNTLEWNDCHECMREIVGCMESN
jgi:hypothetical protein